MAFSITAIGGNTKLRTSNGWKSIADLSDDDLVWDGAYWVFHEGLEFKTSSMVVEAGGVPMVPSSALSSDGGWTRVTAAEIADSRLPSMRVYAVLGVYSYVVQGADDDIVMFNY